MELKNRSQFLMILMLSQRKWWINQWTHPRRRLFYHPFPWKRVLGFTRPLQRLWKKTESFINREVKDGDVSHCTETDQFFIEDEQTDVKDGPDGARIFTVEEILEFVNNICTHSQRCKISPDGMIPLPEPGIIEIKCPYTAKELNINEYCESHNTCLEIKDGKPRLKRAHDYFYQIQHNMYVCGVSWCDFIV